MTEIKKHYTFLQMLLVCAIALVVNLFVFYSLEAVKPAPRYENFCTEKITSVTPQSPDACTEMGGQWNAAAPEAKMVPGDQAMPAGYCNTTFSCQKDFDVANQKHSGLAFMVLTIIGGILIVLSFVLKGSSVVNNGLGLAGLISIFIGSTTNWTYLFPIAKVVLLGVVLVAILTFAWRTFKD